mmetsp:Transcript_18331/g.43105  ORF Transcript_18331/g.43105 Transcript_18331/m.43105 type:complete len:321 (+) Transcript_18331:35-997(+)
MAAMAEPTLFLADHRGKTTQSGSKLRVVSFNVERGYKVDGIISYLRTLDPDIVLLQECDLACDRTAKRNIADYIAAALEMKVCWASEFEELASPLRTARLAGGGSHGNAVLTKFEVLSHGAFRHTQCFDWTRSKTQPRTGGRVVVWCDVQIPETGSILRCYSAHLENFCGALQRVEQFSEILKHARHHEGPVIIGGDLNTLMHGVIRFLPMFYPSDDFLRYQSLGQSEAAWWRRNVLTNCTEVAAKYPRLKCLEGLGADGYSDPFDDERDTTVNNWIWKAKLDWLLSKGLASELWGKGGDGLSDHLCIWVDYQVPARSRM